MNIKTNKIFPNFSKKEPTKKKTKQISSSKNLFNHSDCTNTKNKQILEIKGFRDFGLLLLIPFEYKKKFSLEDIRNKLFLIWISIGSHVKLSVTEIIYNFDLFINEIMNRRERNIKNWITNLTSSFEDKNINALKNLNISLNEKWKICKETCSFCYYKCTKISGHIEEHDCGFDHICHEECEICKIINCEESKNCKKICRNNKSGHFKEPHSCSHIHHCQKICSKNNLRGCGQKCLLEYGHKEECFCGEIHLCNEFCIYKDCSKGCKIDCYLPIGHNGEHTCSSNEHKCTLECSFKNKSRGCINDGICILNLPHSLDNHNCGGKHKCKEKCNLADKAENCGMECSLPYGHFDDHICSNIHKCKEKCSLYENSRGCNIKCSLNYGHDSSHICNMKHYCNKNCYYNTKSKSCINEKCNLEYDHIGKCNCGADKHLCFEKCSVEQCKNYCQLLCEHKEILHDCKEFHKCLKTCSLKMNSKEDTCNNICNLPLGHEGDCFCSLDKEKHFCNKKCKKCSNLCNLIVNHEGECICGTCTCDADCIYKNKSHNCKQKCKELYGHDGPHICIVKNHLCKEKCSYEKKTRKKNGGCLGYCILPMDHDNTIKHYCGVEKEKHICVKICNLFMNSSKDSCGQFCNRPIDHEGPCLCQYSEEKHICDKVCSLHEIKGCEYKCSLPTNHEGSCLCSVGEKGHLCDKECSYFKVTRIGCKGKCILQYNHPKDQDCICSNNINEHIHNGQCYLNSKSREGCDNSCKLPVNHEGYCICEKSPNQHICNQKCDLINISFEGSCHKDCIKQAGHAGEHICISKKHECNEPCKYRNLSKSGCLGHCSKEVGHKDVMFPFLFNPDHLCQNSMEIHICNKVCELRDKSREGCKGVCDKPIEHSGYHLCNSDNHICKEKCYFFDRCEKDCHGLCIKKVGHKDRHECDIKKHFCGKICYLNKVSRFCSSECALLCDHIGECICKKKINEHFCNNKCVLCADYCCHVYDHKGPHLCNNEHDCNKICDKNGYCEIKTNNVIKRKISHTLKNKIQKIEYFESSEQIFIRKKCIKKIPKGLISHKGNHICDINEHKCGFKCKQCNRLCELEYGHPSFHYCKHGHIKNAIIQAEEDKVEIKFQNEIFDFKNDDEAIMFTCYQYCREQRRGHVHRLNYKDLIDMGINLKSEGIRKLNKNTYECKCEFFWKIFLQFRFETEFDNESIYEFNQCSSKCGNCLKFNETTYCNLKLWHQEKEHNFPCRHAKSIPYHTIFIIDKSDSMGSPDIKPTNENLYKFDDFNNRLGCVIQVINNYVNKRFEVNKKDIFSLISFSTEATINFRDLNKDIISNIDFIDECKAQFEYPKGSSCFINGFKEAEKILSDIDNENYNPLIILLSDGDDDNPKETIEYVKEVSNFLLK